MSDENPIGPPDASIATTGPGGAGAGAPGSTGASAPMGAGAGAPGSTGASAPVGAPTDEPRGSSGTPIDLSSPKAPPGSVGRRRLHPKVDWELFACGLHGHDLVGTDAAEIRPEDAGFVREVDNARWYRCLRCDAWVVLDPPAQPARQYPPPASEVQVPLKGRRLRDRYVLRIIVIDRAVHVAVLGVLTAAIFLFAQHRTFLHHEYTKVLAALQGGVGGPVGSSHSGLVKDLDRLFALSTTKLYLAGVALAAYTAVLIAEAVGLWRARRWAEYLTLVETGLLVPFEIYELTGGVTALKVLTLVINLAIVLYLLIAHRLFGIRGGRAAALSDYGEQG